MIENSDHAHATFAAPGVDAVSGKQPVYPSDGAAKYRLGMNPGLKLSTRKIQSLRPLPHDGAGYVA
jgi:hypothetical protein